MARPREFDEQAVLDLTTQRFWSKGYEATSMRDLADSTGVTTASLYNAFGDKRALYRLVLDRYVRLALTACAEIFGGRLAFRDPSAVGNADRGGGCLDAVLRSWQQAAGTVR